jgi:uncharacterized membrane protein YgcG
MLLQNFNRPAGIIAILLLYTGYAYAQPPEKNDFSDRILSFHSAINVQKNGIIQVTEFITIYNGDAENTPGYNNSNSVSNNNDIKRGIVRDFPTKYADSSGFWAETGFRLIGVYKNDQKEPYNLENKNNGKEIIIGRKDVLLAPGIYRYRIEYETNRQLIFHKDKDELYWNVNGNGWVFSTDTISCNITFPNGALIKEFDCYTGLQGASGTNCEAKETGPGRISFITTKRAEPYEGLTVAVSIEKGILTAPSSLQNLLAFLRANYIIPLLAFLLIFLLAYYFYVWYKKGRDPEKAVIYPQFSPPAGLTPPDVGYIMEQQFGSHLFAAALIDCAVKKNLDIRITREGFLFKTNEYHFSKPADLNNVPDTKAEYGFKLDDLYGQTAQKGKYNSILKSSYDSLQNALKERFQIRKGKTNKWQGLFVLNKGYVLIGTLIFIAAVFLSFQFFVSHPSFRIVIISVIFLCAMLIVHVIFKRIMSAYTKKGREIADHLLGFKMYLAQAEQHVYNQLSPPEKTLDLFEKYLPYAVALKVENDWADKFDSIMQKALAEGYQPAYYGVTGSTMHSFTMSDISRNISSGLSSTISSASTPPGSSSGGSSGGGSSGGGGGGGGGGGW